MTDHHGSQCRHCYEYVPHGGPKHNCKERPKKKVVPRFHASGPWPTRELRLCVQAESYDDLAKRAKRLEQALRGVEPYLAKGKGYEGTPYGKVIAAVQAVLSE